MSAQNPTVEAAKELGLELREDQYAAARQLLVQKIAGLLDSNFPQLVSILYRLDIYEKKLRVLLRENPDTDAAELIADLIIERQAQKIKSREEYRRQQNDIDEEEKW